MTRRTTFLFICLLIAALPLIWFSVDPNAGETMLRVIQKFEGKNAAPSATPGAAQKK
jgi:hypothetical protein